jgi:multiple sugar transport system substrate-binding protein
MNRTPRSRIWAPALAALTTLTLVVTACGGGASPGTSAAATSGASQAAGASSAPGSSTGTGTATEWSKAFEGTQLSMIAEATLNSQVLEGLLPDFTAKTGIDVSIEQAPYDSVIQKLTLDATTKQGGYDIVSLPYEFLGTFAEKGWIAPIDDRLADSASFGPGFDPTAVIPALWKASSVWRDKTYGFPSNSAVMMMFYRKDLFDSADEQDVFKTKYGYDLAVPQTWQQYKDAAEFFTRKAGGTLAGATLAKDFAGVAMTGKRHVATVLEWFNYAWTYGGGILDDSGNLIVDSTQSVESLDYMAGLRPLAQAGYTNATWDETTATLQQGNAALSITWGDTAGAMEATDQSAVIGKMGYASIPTLKEGDTPLAHLGSWTYVIPSGSTKQDAAWLFMQWAMSADVQTALAKGGGLPATTSSFEDPALVSSLPYWKQELTSLSESKSRPRIPEWGQLSDILQKQISDVISGQASSTDALKGASDQLKAVLPLPILYQ